MVKDLLGTGVAVVLGVVGEILLFIIVRDRMRSRKIYPNYNRIPCYWPNVLMHKVDVLRRAIN